MFRCLDCDKEYKTRTSLTRHSHNHASQQHVCETCGVVFARRDILNRHASNGHCAKERKGKGRCHTACSACRKARVKCDGEDPCGPCVHGKKECKFPKTTGRVSWSMKLGRASRDNDLDRDKSLQIMDDSTVEGQRSINFTVSDRNSTEESHDADLGKENVAEIRSDQIDDYLDGRNHDYENKSTWKTAYEPCHDNDESHAAYEHHVSGTAGEVLDRADVIINSAYGDRFSQNPPLIKPQTASVESHEYHRHSQDVNSLRSPPKDEAGVEANLQHAFTEAARTSHTSESGIQSAIHDHLNRQRYLTGKLQTETTKSDIELLGLGATAASAEQAKPSTTRTEKVLNGNGHWNQSASDRRHFSSTSLAVHHLQWPWIHERNFMGSKSKGRAPEKPCSPANETANGHSLTPESIGSPAEMSSEYRDPITPLANVIESLVAYAASTAYTPEHHATRRRYWQSTSLQLSEIFYSHGDRSRTAADKTLYGFADAYMKNFNVIWPLLNHEQLDPDTQHPVLFLVVTSIGAAFSQPLQRQYGALMHVRLRRLLCASLYDLEGSSHDEMVWLAQARLLTQVASLYFGQHQGFSYSQHLAAITIAQMRRMDFFREPIPDITKHVWRPQVTEIAQWQHAETRRRLAYGILRTDVYNSVLLSTRPLLTSEEVKLTFPRSSKLWMNEENLNSLDRLQAQRAEDEQTLPMPLSDLVRIFLDKNEAKPELGPDGYELALFGLQEWVWRFSHDTELYVRLTGRCLDGTKIDIPRTLPPREMKDLRADYSRVRHALDAWYQGIDRAIARGMFEQHHDLLMSCLLLYRLTRLRMSAPLNDLHHVSYRAADITTIDANIYSGVHAWMRSPFAKEAAEQAWDIKMLIERALKRGGRFNFLAFCSLHHSAVVLWTYAGVRQEYPTSNLGETFCPPHEDVETFIKDCANMFSQLSPLGGSSFEAAARRLHVHRFPQYLPQYHEAVR